jgi:hypothetical protein
MPGQICRTRQQQIINYQANGLVISNQLGLGMLYRELLLELQGTIASTNNHAGTNGIYTTTTLLGGDEWGLIQKLEIVVNGGDTIRSFKGEELAMYNTLLFKRPRRLCPNFGATKTSSIFDSVLILPFWDYKSASPIDTLLDSSKLSDFRVQVTWGSDLNMVNFTGSTFTTAPTLTVSSRESYGLAGRFSVSRNFKITNPASIGAQKGYTIQLPLGNIYKGFFINTKDVNGNDLADCIDRVQLISGTNVFLDCNYKALRNWQTLRKGQMIGVVDSTLAQIPCAVSALTNVDAWTYMDLIDDGYVTEAIDTYKLSELKLQFDVNQTITTLTIIPDQLIPVRGAKKTGK